MTSMPHVRQWRSRTVLGIGEAMPDFAAVGGDTYRRGFAGDTLNTCWNMRTIDALFASARPGRFERP